MCIFADPIIPHIHYKSPCETHVIGQQREMRISYLIAYFTDYNRKILRNSRIKVMITRSCKHTEILINNLIKFIIYFIRDVSTHYLHMQIYKVFQKKNIPHVWSIQYKISKRIFLRNFLSNPSKFFSLYMRERLLPFYLYDLDKLYKNIIIYIIFYLFISHICLLEDKE